jgi:hypothetical protein
MELLMAQIGSSSIAFPLNRGESRMIERRTELAVKTDIARYRNIMQREVD